MTRPAQKSARDRAVYREEEGNRQGGIFQQLRQRLCIDNALSPLVQQFVPVIAASRLVTGVSNQSLNLLGI